MRLSDLFQSAPPEVIRALAFLLVARLLSRKAPRVEERIYRSYAFSPQLLRASDLARKQRGRKIISSAQGKIYDLDKIFARLPMPQIEDALTEVAAIAKDAADGNWEKVKSDLSAKAGDVIVRLVDDIPVDLDRERLARHARGNGHSDGGRRHEVP